MVQEGKSHIRSIIDMVFIAASCDFFRPWRGVAEDAIRTFFGDINQETSTFAQSVWTELLEAKERLSEFRFSVMAYFRKTNFFFLSLTGSSQV